MPWFVHSQYVNTARDRLVLCVAFHTGLISLPSFPTAAGSNLQYTLRVCVCVRVCEAVTFLWWVLQTSWDAPSCCEWLNGSCLCSVKNVCFVNSIVSMAPLYRQEKKANQIVVSISDCNDLNIWSVSSPTKLKWDLWCVCNLTDLHIV